MSLDAIKELREQTNCGIIDCKKALAEAGGDLQKAKALLRERGLQMALKKASRVATEGRVDAYIHNGNRIGVIIEVNCETDFVARNDDFVAFTKNVAMHIAAMSPKYIKKDEVPADVLKAEEDQDAFMKASVLLEQPFVKDPSKTIQDLLNELVAKMGENILIGRFARYKIGE
ncbi:MAG: translation elongation factor Ts [Candidatus Omnitrophica bacterium]|nr:translation elongation factor Ts [Candidatus Omnitrophota bacterium]